MMQELAILLHFIKNKWYDKLGLAGAEILAVRCQWVVTTPDGPESGNVIQDKGRQKSKLLGKVGIGLF